MGQFGGVKSEENINKIELEGKDIISWELRGLWSCHETHGRAEHNCRSFIEEIVDRC